MSAKVIQVTEPVYDALTKLKQELAQKLGRAPSYGEVIERLLEKAEAA